MALGALRKAAYRHLEPGAWPKKGLSPVNIFLVGLIFVAVIQAVIETEPLIARGREMMFRYLEVAIGIVFMIEYAARVWIAPENPRFAKSRFPRLRYMVGSSRVDLQACKLEYSIVSPK